MAWLAALLKASFLGWLRRLVLAFVVFTVGWVALYRWVNPPGTLQWLLEEGNTTQHWVPLDSLAPCFIKCVVLVQDPMFLYHQGLRPGQVTDLVARAPLDSIFSLKTQEVLANEPTLSHRTAELLFLWPGDAWLREVLAAWYTFWLELLCSKQRILELYLNVVPMGANTAGVDAGAWRHFQRPVTQLGPRSQAALAARTRYPLAAPGREGWSSYRKLAAQLRQTAPHLPDALFQQVLRNHGPQICPPNP